MAYGKHARRQGQDGAKDITQSIPGKEGSTQRVRGDDTFNIQEKEGSKLRAGGGDDTCNIQEEDGSTMKKDDSARGKLKNTREKLQNTHAHDGRNGSGVPDCRDVAAVAVLRSDDVCMLVGFESVRMEWVDAESGEVLGQVCVRMCVCTYINIYIYIYI
jgi:hypothetical protein